MCTFTAQRGSVTGRAGGNGIYGASAAALGLWSNDDRLRDREKLGIQRSDHHARWPMRIATRAQTKTRQNRKCNPELYRPLHSRLYFFPWRFLPVSKVMMIHPRAANAHGCLSQTPGAPHAQGLSARLVPDFADALMSAPELTAQKGCRIPPDREVGLLPIT